MILLSFLITCGVLFTGYRFFSAKLNTLELILQFAVPTIVSILFYFLTVWGLTSDSEYWGGWITKIVHTEDWNEYVHQTCTRTVGSGKNARTETYDCSYVRYHPEQWIAYDSNGLNYSVSEGMYKNWAGIWGWSKTGHISGYTNSADVFTTFYDNVPAHLRPSVTIHRYTNKVAASNSVFNFRKLSEQEIEDNALFDYPKTEEGYCPSVLGYKNCPCFDRINSKLGKSKQIRVWILVFRGNMSQFELQKQYWRNGNKNELILCFGLGNDDTVRWSNLMTWCEQDEFNAKVKRAMSDQIGTKFDTCELAGRIEPLIKEGWVRKEFADFDYLKVSIPFYLTMIALLITLLLNGGLLYINLNYDLGNNHGSWR